MVNPFVLEKSKAFFTSNASYNYKPKNIYIALREVCLNILYFAFLRYMRKMKKDPYVSIEIPSVN